MQNEKKNRWVWFLILAFWMLIAVLYTSQNLLSKIVQGGEIDWARLLVWSLTRWVIWAVLTPIVFTMARRFPLERTQFSRGILTHLGVGTSISLVHLAIEITVLYLIWLAFGEAIQIKERFVSLLTYTFHVNLLIYWAIVGAYKAFDYYQRFRERELKASQLETQLTQAQLQTLKAQIHPHFLFNTHHAILGLMMKNKNEAAIKMLTGLSDLLRLTLETTEAQETSLKKELEFLNLYLEIQQTRFQDRLRVKMDIAKETLNARIPNLIMQPLVENAIEHGIAPYSNAGFLEIRSSRENGKLKLQVKDDGPGLTRIKDQTIKEGVGLKNTRARLEQLYNSAYEFELSNATDGGLLVTLTIPFQVYKP